MTQDDRMETITDPAVIRACDEPDERGDFPCCADRAHKESLGGDSESGTYNRSNRPPAGPCTDERTTPAPSSGAGPDLDALYETICDNFTGMAEVQQAADLLVAEVRRLVKYRDWWKASSLANAEDVRRLAAICHDWRDRSEAAEAEVRRLTEDIDQCWVPLYHDTKHERDQAEARAESAEAEVVTLRAKVAAVEALADQWADRKRSDGMSGNAWIGLTLSGVAADLRAALATTGEGQ